MPIPADPSNGRPFHGDLPPLDHFENPGKYQEVLAPDGTVLALFDGETLHYRNEHATLRLIFPDHPNFIERCERRWMTQEEYADTLDAKGRRLYAAMRELFQSAEHEKAIKTTTAMLHTTADYIRNQ